jgi:hypothetical protein
VLPFTGVDSEGLFVIALALLGLGLATVGVSRRSVDENIG